MKPIEFSDFISSAAARRESWRRKLEGTGFRGAVPNAGHDALHVLWERGQLKAVITQNVDGLHQDSGIPPDQVIELHGNTTYARCLSCAKRYEIEDMLEVFRRTENGPICDDCGGYIKTATISFGQSMPEEEMIRAEIVASDCDLFLVLGTSLAVYPAAAFPMMARAAGAKLVILNREATDQDGLADLVVHDELGDTLTYAVGQKPTA